MDIKITPCKLKGSMEIPPSKSYSHRALIAAYLGGGEAIGVGESADTRATRECLEALKEGRALYANESGSTLRFMIPIAVNGEVNISGSERLMERPLDDYFKIFNEKGIEYSLENNTLYAKGNLTGGDYFIRGDVSSQFITGLLFALPLIKEDSRIVITTRLESRAYVDMTLDVLKKFGIEIKEEENCYLIKGNQKYKSEKYTVEGDFSQAAFFLATGDVTLTGLNPNSIQGDKEIVEVYRAMGMEIEEKDNLYITKGRAVRNITVDVSQIPDCVPVLACVMAVTPGEGRIINAARLRIKESDRLQATQELLKQLGVDSEVSADSDTLRVFGPVSLKGGFAAEARNDHRLVMFLAAAALIADAPITVHGVECLNKSWPGFLDIFRKLGGKAE